MIQDIKFVLASLTIYLLLTALIVASHSLLAFIHIQRFMILGGWLVFFLLGLTISRRSKRRIYENRR